MEKDNFFTHKFLPILGFILFVLFILFINTDVYAAISSDLSTLTESQKETIAKTWQAAVSYCESQGIDVEKSNYCVTYSNGSSSFCSVFILNPSKNTLFELGTTNGSKNWFNYGIYFDCQVGGNPVNRWGGYNNSTTIATYYFNGDTSFIIANNVKTSNNSYKQISRSIEDVYFIKDPFNKGYNYSIELSTTDNTYDPIYAYSNYFNIDDLNNYEVYVSTDNIDYELMNIETMNHLDGSCEFRFNYKIFTNGVFYFKFVDVINNENTYITFEVTNILKNSINSGFNSDGIPQPFVTYSRKVDKFILQTQSFMYDDFKKLECYYTTDPSLDYSFWDKMSLGTLNNTITGTVEYFFFFSVPQYSEDTTYYFVFYDTTLQKYGYKSSLNCVFDKMNEYEDNVSGVVDEKNSKFDELIQFFNKRFGFLTYPFEFIANLLNKILHIHFEEPILHFPQIVNPINDEVIFEGFDYNFNSILQYEGISYFYNIYLICVDAILIFAFVIGCKNIIEEVFGNG